MTGSLLTLQGVCNSQLHYCLEDLRVPGMTSVLLCASPAFIVLTTLQIFLHSARSPIAESNYTVTGVFQLGPCVMLPNSHVEQFLIRLLILFLPPSFLCYFSPTSLHIQLPGMQAMIVEHECSSAFRSSLKISEVL